MLPDKDEKQNNEFIELLKKISQLELEIHSRGELTFSEVTSLLKDFYFFGATMYDQGTYNSIADSTYTRLAALLSLWASCEDIQLSLEDMCEFLLYKEIISSIFYCSGFRGFNHLKTYLAERTPEGNFTIPQNKLIIYFLFVHIDELDPYYLSLAKKMPEAIFTVLMLGWLNCSVVLTLQGENNRSDLYTLSTLLTKVNPNHKFMTSVVNAWMYCSYSPNSNKREIKKNINIMIRNFLRTNKLIAPKIKVVEKRQKPRMLVIHERAGRNHAMFRCYMPIFSSLSMKFDVYSMAENEIDDDISKAVFPNHIIVNDAKDLNGLIKTIADLAPDIIYYPSLGMSHWTIYLANLRLAPMQVMSCGHPESSFSDMIDFIYYGPVLPRAESLASENILQCVEYRYTAIEHGDLSAVKLHNEKFSSDCKHIAINCSAMKLSSTFIQLLKKIKDLLGDKIKFHFFPASYGLLNDGLKNMLLKHFPDAVAYSPMPYTRFLETLSRCHFSLAPFPFGNTNSTVDSMLLGLPVVALKGHEFCSYTDYLVLKSFGLDEHFMCDSLDAYLHNVTKLVNDEAHYAAEVQYIKSVDIKAMLTVKKERASEFGGFISTVYQKLNMYKSAKHKLITWSNDHIV